MVQKCLKPRGTDVIHGSPSVEPIECGVRAWASVNLSWKILGGEFHYFLSYLIMTIIHFFNTCHRCFMSLELLTLMYFITCIMASSVVGIQLSDKQREKDPAPNCMRQEASSILVVVQTVKAVPKFA